MFQMSSQPQVISGRVIQFVNEEVILLVSHPTGHPKFVSNRLWILSNFWSVAVYVVSVIRWDIVIFVQGDIFAEYLWSPF